MKTIILHGILAKKFGKYFKLDVSSAKEATHAIASQLPAFRQFMLDSERLGLRFAIFTGSRTRDNNISAEQIEHTTTAETIHIVPRLIGAGGKNGGWLQVIAGVILVAVGYFTFGATSAYGAALIGAGLGMTIGGVATLLMPTPPMDEQNEDGNRPNNGFGGAVTTVAQGNPVPILYGERKIGGFVASAAIYAEDKVIAGASV